MKKLVSLRTGKVSLKVACKGRVSLKVVVLKDKGSPKEAQVQPKILLQVVLTEQDSRVAKEALRDQASLVVVHKDK